MPSLAQLALVLASLFAVPASAQVCLESTAKPVSDYDFTCPIHFAATTSFRDFIGPKPKIDEEPGGWTFDPDGKLVVNVAYQVMVNNSEAARNLLSDDTNFAVLAGDFARVLKRQICDRNFGSDRPLGRRVLELSVQVGLDKLAAVADQADLARNISVRIDNCEAH